MHFPPRDDDGEILIPAEDEWTDAELDTSNDRDIMLSGWSEPVTRSDQMCRSLIGMAYVLAYELGIFGDYANGIVPAEERIQTHNSTANQRLERSGSNEPFMSLLPRPVAVSGFPAYTKTKSTNSVSMISSTALIQVRLR